MARISHKARHSRRKRREITRLRLRKCKRKELELRHGPPVIIRTVVPMTRLEKKSIRRIILMAGGSVAQANRMVRDTANLRAQGLPFENKRRSK